MRVYIQYCKRTRLFNVEADSQVRDVKILLIKEKLIQKIYEIDLFFENHLIKEGTLEEAGVRDRSTIHARPTIYTPFDLQIRTIKNIKYYFEIAPDTTCSSLLKKFYARTKNDPNNKLDPQQNLLILNGKIVTDFDESILDYIYFTDDVAYSVPIPVHDDEKITCFIYLGDSLIMDAVIPKESHTDVLHEYISQVYHIPASSQTLYHQDVPIFAHNEIHSLNGGDGYVILNLKITGKIKVTILINGQNVSGDFDCEKTLKEVKYDIFAKRQITATNQILRFEGVECNDNDLLFSFNSFDLFFTLSTDPVPADVLTKYDTLIKAPANQGDPSAMYFYGIMLIKGTIIPKNVEQGISFLTRAAEKGHSNASVELSNLMTLGIISEPQIGAALINSAHAANFGNVSGMYITAQLSRRISKYSDSVKYLKMAIEKGHIEAKTSYAHLILEGNADTNQIERAKKLLKEASDAGEPDAMRTLAKLLVKDNRIEEGISLMKQSADLGSSTSYYYLANYSLTQNKIMDSVFFAQKAAEMGNVSGMRMLGLMKKRGLGMSKSYEEAFELFNKSSNAGDLIAKYQLAKMYLKGDGCDKNEPKAVVLLKENISKNHGPSVILLANLQIRGIGCAKSETTAFDLVSKFSDKGLVKATRLVGIMNAEGIGTAQNIEEATRNLEIASKSDKIAQFHLAMILKNGPGYPANRSEVIKYLQLAADQNLKEAQEELGLLLNETDKQNAEKYFRMASDHGSIESQYQLALLLMNIAKEKKVALEEMLKANETDQGNDINDEKIKLIREEIERREKEAAEIFKKCCDQGHPLGTYYYSLCLKDGIGLDQDLFEAERILTIATQLKVPIALFDKGNDLILKGEKDNKQSLVDQGLILLREAAEKNFVPSMLSIAEYLTKVNIDANEEEILLWLERASHLGSYKASYLSGKILESHGHLFEAFQAFKEASKGFSPALDDYARYLEKGLGTPVNESEAFINYEKAIQAKCIKSYAHLGNCYEKGIGTQQNYRLALDLYEKGAEFDDEEAMLGAGKLYLYGLGTEKNGLKAREYFERAVQKKQIEAHLQLGIIFEEGIDVNVDNRKSFDLFKFAAEHGNSEAMVLFGKKLIHGNNCEKNEEMGKSFLIQAIQLQNKDAMFELAELYYSQKDIDNAKVYYLQAADLGHIEAMNCISIHLLETDPEKAISFLQKASEAGNINAQINYGLHLASGDKCVRNIHLAKKWLQEASDSGNIEGIYNYGVLLLSTNDPQDFIEGQRILKIASDRGHTYAMYNLAIVQLNEYQKLVNLNLLPTTSAQNNHQPVSENELNELLNSTILLLRQSADKGCFEAMGLAAYYLNEKDEELEIAFNYAKTAAENGDNEAKLLYASMLMAARGTIKDTNRAGGMLIDLGDEGISDGYYHYALALEEGIGVYKDQEAALDYFKKAAALGDERAKGKIDT